MSEVVDRYNININILLLKNLLMVTIQLWVKKLREILKLLSLKLVIETELLIIKIFSSKSYTKNWSKEKSMINAVFKPNNWT